MNACIACRIVQLVILKLYFALVFFPFLFLFCHFFRMKTMTSKPWTIGSIDRKKVHEQPGSTSIPTKSPTPSTKRTTSYAELVFICHLGFLKVNLWKISWWMMSHDHLRFAYINENAEQNTFVHNIHQNVHHFIHWFTWFLCRFFSLHKHKWVHSETSRRKDKAIKCISRIWKIQRFVHYMNPPMLWISSTERFNFNDVLLFWMEMCAAIKLNRAKQNKTK